MLASRQITGIGGRRSIGLRRSGMRNVIRTQHFHHQASSPIIPKGPGLVSLNPEHLSPLPEDSTHLLAEVETLGSRLALVRERIGRIIFGQGEVVDQALITLIAGGHALLIGVPGLAKTRLVETLGTILGLEDKRIQCTPDLMPADIIGSEVLEEDENRRRSFRFIPGPVFCQLLMADEINRASPRTQSALLQAMQEGRVSIAGRYHPLPRPFHVLATQNPLEQEGTYPLPEAQLDRFLLQIDVGYPDIAAERSMLIATTGLVEERATPVMTAQELSQAQRLVRRIPVGESVVEAILSLVRSGRPESSAIPEAQRHVAWGPGPRASQALMLACRARALLENRLAPSVDDVLALAAPVLRHRMALNFAARADGVTLTQVIDRLTAQLQ
jgi:MoxR-like ATPase